MSDREPLSKKALAVSSKMILWFFIISAEQAQKLRHKYIKTILMNLFKLVEMTTLDFQFCVWLDF